MNPAITPILLEQVRHAFEQISDLPLRVHVTDIQGHFLFANAEARAMFGLDKEPEGAQRSIADFYEDERERQFVLRELKKLSPGQWRKGFTALLHIQGERRKVRFPPNLFLTSRATCLPC